MSARRPRLTFLECGGGEPLDAGRAREAHVGRSPPNKLLALEWEEGAGGGGPGAAAGPAAGRGARGRAWPWAELALFPGSGTITLLRSGRASAAHASSAPGAAPAAACEAGWGSQGEGCRWQAEDEPTWSANCIAWLESFDLEECWDRRLTESFLAGALARAPAPVGPDTADDAGPAADEAPPHHYHPAADEAPAHHYTPAPAASESSGRTATASSASTLEPASSGSCCFCADAPLDGPGRGSDGAGSGSAGSGGGGAGSSWATYCSQHSSSKVYSCLYDRSPAAVKVLPAHGDAGLAMRNAVEMAVLSSARHPNIALAYACLTAGAARLPAGASALLEPRAAPLGPAPPAAGLPALPAWCGGGGLCDCDAVVMELCDQGSLRDALNSGLILPAAPGRAPAELAAVAAHVLAGVGAALRHLHRMRLVHGDIRAESVLLKSEPTCAAGVTAKLCGFGKARILDTSGCDVAPLAAARAAGGPPLLRAGAGAGRAGPAGGRGPEGRARAPFAEDVRAFGALILEVLEALPCCGGPRGPATAAAAARLASAGAGCAACGGFLEVAAECLAAAAPSMSDVLCRLDALPAAG